MVSSFSCLMPIPGNKWRAFKRFQTAINGGSDQALRFPRVWMVCVTFVWCSCGICHQTSSKRICYMHTCFMASPFPSSEVASPSLCSRDPTSRYRSTHWGNASSPKQPSPPWALLQGSSSKAFTRHPVLALLSLPLPPAFSLPGYFFLANTEAATVFFLASR